METINNTFTSNYSTLCDVCRNAAATYETKEAAVALDARVDAVIAQVQARMTAVASCGPSVPEPATREIDVATPANADHDQATGVPGYP